MSIETPYQSPEYFSMRTPKILDEVLVFRKCPTWRFWVQTVSGFSGLLSILLQAHFARLEKTDYSFEISCVFLLIASAVFIGVTVTVLAYWSSPAKEEAQPDLAWKSERLFAGICWHSFVAGLLTCHFSFSMFHICLERRFDWRGTDDFAFYVAWFLSSFVGSIITCLGFGLWVDTGAIRVKAKIHQSKL